MLNHNIYRGPNDAYTYILFTVIHTHTQRISASRHILSEFSGG